MEFCYKKHGPPNINKPNSSANSSSSNVNDSYQSNSTLEVNHQDTITLVLTREKYDNLMCLLQQVKLIPSPGHDIGSSTNHLNTFIFSHINHSLDEPRQSSIPIVTTYSVSNNIKVWLLDSGANDHIYFFRSWFTSFYQIKLIKVHLPNGNLVLGHCAGNIHFSPQLYITNVLYSLEFGLNLISISKLC